MGRIPKTSRKEISFTKRTKIIDYYKFSYSISSIYQSFRLPCFIIRFIINRYKNEKNLDFKNKPRFGIILTLFSKNKKHFFRYITTYIKNTFFIFYSFSKSNKKLKYIIIKKILKIYSKTKKRPKKKS